MRTVPLRIRLVSASGFSLLALLITQLFGSPALAARSPSACEYGWLSNQAPSYVEYQWRDITAAGQKITPTGVSDDTVFTTDIGFDFKAYLDNVSQVTVSSDGFVVFGPLGAESSTNDPLPSENLSGPAVAAFWDDLEVRSDRGAGIFVETRGDYPRREFVIEFYKLNHWPNLQGEITFEVVLFEGSNEVLLQYQDTIFNGYVSDEGGGATVGMQGMKFSAGNLVSSATQVSYNQAIITNGLAVLIDPDFVSPEVAIPSTDKTTLAPAAAESVTLTTNVSDARCETEASFDIVNASGCVVRSLQAGGAGKTRTATWDGKDEAGAVIPAGLYSVEAQSSDGLNVGSRSSREHNDVTKRQILVVGDPPAVPSEVDPENPTGALSCASAALPDGELFRGSQRLLSGSGVFKGDTDPGVTVTGPALPENGIASTVCAPAQGAWTRSTSEAEWISVGPCLNNRAAGTYRYKVNFELPASYTQPLVSLQFMSDDSAKVFLNGTELASGNGFSEPAYFESADETTFKPGANELVFEVVNGGSTPNPTGLWFDATVNYAVAALVQPPAVSPLPEPSPPVPLPTISEEPSTPPVPEPTVSATETPLPLPTL